MARTDRQGEGGRQHVVTAGFRRGYTCQHPRTITVPSPKILAGARMTHSLARCAGLTALALSAVACSSPTGTDSTAPPLITALPRSLSADEQIAATATTNFGLALFRQVNARTARDSNLALSPISASLALGMLMVGAEGETLDQVRQTLGFGTRAVTDVAASYKAIIPLISGLDPTVQMRFANSAWFATTAPPAATFRQTLTDAFGARVDTLPFTAPSTVTTINGWVANATNDRILSIVDDLGPDDLAVLINATYFKGQWRAQFDPAQTRSADFRVTPTTVLQVPTMSTENGLVRLGQLDGTVIGELPFGGDAFAMTILMPQAGTLESFVDSLTPARWQALLSRLPPASAELAIRLPKFRLEVKRRLNDDLAALGMPRPFRNAELNPMFQTPATNRFIAYVDQKVFVDVNEEGAEAAAVTAVGIRQTSAPPSLTIDRPFLFVIRERLSGTILFIGKVVRPMAP
jgi:serine protease inhibitor